MEIEFVVGHISKSQSNAGKIVYTAILQAAKVVQINSIQMNPNPQQPRQLVLPAKLEISGLDPYQFDVNDVVTVTLTKK